MTVGLIDVDGHNFPNLALMRLSSYHKARGDSVEWWNPEAELYDLVYMSKVFSDEYSPDKPTPRNARFVIRGGTGYAIETVNGRERFHKERCPALPDEIERSFPDYSIYPQHNFAVALTSRGCPRNCGFCHVSQKEGKRSVKVADLSDFYDGQPHVEVLDPNITACDQKRELFLQYRDVCKPRTGGDRNI